jgi:hypothetical protein
MREYAWQDTGLNAHFRQGFDAEHPDPSNFMGSCKIDEGLCKDVYREHLSTYRDFVESMRYHGLTKEESKQSAYTSAVDDLMRSCRAHVGQFVLIYFPPTISAREICANSSKETSWRSENQSEKPLMTAALTAITIGTNTHSGNFTFTSPSIYLAYDSAQVWRGCSRIGATHGPGILTLPPGVLKSLSYSRVTTYTPPSDYDLIMSAWIGSKYTSKIYENWMPRYETLNLADFQSPYLSSAWFASKPYCRSKLALNGGSIFEFQDNCTETIFEDGGPQRPTFAIPDLFTMIDPEWTSCSGAFLDPVNGILNMLEDGIPDPPLALPTASTLVLPTITAKASATPHQIPSSPFARPTKERELGETPALIWKPVFNSPSQTVINLGTASLSLKFLGPTVIVAGTSTLSANGPAATIRGQVVSLGSNVLVAGSRTIQLETTQTPAFTALINGKTITGCKASNGGIVVGSTTLRAGGPALVTGGKTFSMGKTSISLDGTELSFEKPSSPTSTFSVKGALGTRSKAFDGLCLIALFILTTMIVFRAF